MGAPIYLGEQDLADLLDMPETIEVLAELLAADARGRVVNRPRDRIALGTAAGYNLMAAGWPDRGVVGLKVYTVSAHGAPMHVMLHAADGSGLLAVLAAGRLSGLRTGGMTGLAVRELARSADSHVAVIGAGFQAQAQVRGLAAAGVTRILVHARDSARRDDFARRMAEELSIDVTAVETVRDATTGARAIVTITSSAEPVLDAADVDPGTLVVAAGNNSWLKSEIAPELFGGAEFIAVDDLDQARLESGELMRAVERGVTTWSSVTTLAQAVERGVRVSESGIGVFEWQGVASADLAVAEVLYRRAVEAGRGIALG